MKKEKIEPNDNIIIDIDFEEIDREVKEFADRVYGSYSKFRKTLIEDFNHAKELLKVEDKQFSRRTYLRTFFAVVEGLLFAKRTILNEHINEDQRDFCLPTQLTIADIILLKEVDYVLSDNGTVLEREDKFQPFLKYFRFTFDVIARFRKNTDRINYSSSGWESFRIAHKVRNRITHPKSPENLTISDDEMKHIRKAVQWFGEVEKENL